MDEEKKVSHNRKRFIIDDKIECPCCNEWKTLEDFYKWPSGTYGISWNCKECTKAKARANHKAKREKGAEHWESHRKTYRNGYYKRTYGITLKEFEDILESQNSSCAICNEGLDINLDSRKAHMDHNHTTGALRGILCARCNQGIGSFCEDKTKLKSAIEYLEKYNE
jgi:hypothetical protein